MQSSSQTAQMQLQISRLERLIALYFNSSRKEEQISVISKQLTIAAESQRFLEAAMYIMIHQELSNQSATLLTSMIKNKFKACFQVIQDAQLEVYYNCLLAIAHKLGTQHRPIYYNISQALAIIYINKSGGKEDCNLENYISPFNQNQQNYTLFPYYFKILQFCIYDVTKDKIVIDSERRKVSEGKLAQSQISVILTLNQKALQHWSKSNISKKPIISCFSQWVNFSYNKDLLNTLPNLELFQEIIKSLEVQQLSRQASDCIINVIERTKNSIQNDSLFNFLMKVVIDLFGVINKAISERQWNQANQQIQIIITFCTKFLETIMELYSPNLRDFLIAPLTQLFYVDIEEVRRSLATFSTYFLQTILKGKDYDQLSSQFRLEIPLVILMGLVQACRYPTKILQKLDIYSQYKYSCKCEEADEIFRRRMDIQKCFDLVAQIIGNEEYFNYILDFITKLDYQSSDFFSQLEAYLYALHQPIRKLPRITENVVLVVNTYQTFINQQTKIFPVQVRRTFLRVFRSIFIIKQKNAEVIKKTLNLVTNYMSFDESLLNQVSRKAFKIACRQNAGILFQHVNELLTFCLNHLTEWNIIMGFLAVACWDEREAQKYVWQILNSLNEVCLDQHSASLIKRKYNERKDVMKCLSEVFRELKSYSFQNKNLIILRYLQSGAWQFLLKTLKNPQETSSDDDLNVERAVKIFKNIMRLLGNQFLPFVPELYRQVNLTFAQYPICSFVYLVEIAISVFSNEAYSDNLLRPIYQDFSRVALTHLYNYNSLDRYQYLVDDFLGMNLKLLLNYPRILIESTIISDLLVFVSQKCLMTNSIRVLSSVSKFLTTMFQLFWCEQLKDIELQKLQEDETLPQFEDVQLKMRLYQAICSKLKDIVEYMFENLNEFTNHHNQDIITGVLMALVKAFPQFATLIFKDVIQRQPPHVLLQNQKNTLSNLFEEGKYNYQKGHLLKHTMIQIEEMFDLMSRRIVAAEKRRYLME